MGKMQITRRTLLAASLAAVSGEARSQAGEGPYPKGPVRFVVPSAPGGPTDVMARMVSPGLTARLGQPMLIINRPGAGGNIGVVQVAKSPPDGYTLLIASTGFVVNPSLYREPGYDPFKDFLPITELGSSPNVILVHPSSGITSIAQLVETAKRDKNKLNVINPGQGSTPHLTAELLQLRAGIGIENIPYNGAGPAIAALLGKTTPVGITALPPAHAQIKSGALRALAITGEQRWFDLPDADAWRIGISGSRLRDLQECTRRPARLPTSSSGWRAIRSRLPTRSSSRSYAASASTCARAGRKDWPSEVRKEVPMWRDVIVQSHMELQ